MEDDVFVNENLKEELFECVKQLNEHDPEWRLCLLAHPEPHRYDNKWEPTRGKVTEYLCHGGEVWGMGAYLMSRRGMEVFKDEYTHPDTLSPIDNHSYHYTESTYVWKLDRHPREHAVRYHRLDVHGNVIADNEHFYGSIRSNGV